jgi:TPR repeat protein
MPLLRLSWPVTAALSSSQRQCAIVLIRLELQFSHLRPVVKLLDSVALMATARGQKVEANQNNYPLALERAKTCRQRLARTQKWHRISAENGKSMTMSNIESCCDDGTGVERNLTEAAQWFKLSADAGYDMACGSYGFASQFGCGTAKDYQVAMRHFKKGAKTEGCRCCTHLAEMDRNSDGIDVNFTDALKWSRCAAVKSKTSVMVTLGEMLEKEEGISVDLSETAN